MTFVQNAHRILYPILWAEDGVVFLKDSFENGVFSLFMFHEGHFDFIPRALALISKFFLNPIWIPYAYSILALLMWSFCLSYFARPTFERWMSKRHRFIFLLVCGLLPGHAEIPFSLNCMFYSLFVLSFYLIIEPGNASRKKYFYFGLVAFSSAQSFLLLPLSIFLGFKNKLNHQKVFGYILLVAFLTNLTFFLFSSGAPSSGRDFVFVPSHLFYLVEIFIDNFLVRGLFIPLLGAPGYGPWPTRWLQEDPRKFIFGLTFFQASVVWILCMAGLSYVIKKTPQIIKSGQVQIYLMFWIIAMAHYSLVGIVRETDFLRLQDDFRFVGRHAFLGSIATLLFIYGTFLYLNIPKNLKIALVLLFSLNLSYSAKIQFVKHDQIQLAKKLKKLDETGLVNNIILQPPGWKINEIRVK